MALSAALGACVQPEQRRRPGAFKERDRPDGGLSLGRAMQAGYLRRCQQGASTPFRAGCSTWARLNLKLCPKHSIEPVTGLRSKASVEVVVGSR